MHKIQNGSKGDSNPGSLDGEFGILSLSYNSPHVGRNINEYVISELVPCG